MSADNENTNSTRSTKYKILLSIGLMLFINLALPFILYFVLKQYVREILALVISSVPPFIFSIYGFIRKKHVDMLGIIIINSFIVAAVSAVLLADPKLQLLRKSAVKFFLGQAFLISLVPFKIRSFKVRPLMFYFAKDLTTGGSLGDLKSLPGLTEDEPLAARLDRYWDSYPFFRRGIRILTAFWGVGLFCEVLLRAIIIFYVTSVDNAFVLSDIVGYSWLALLGLLNIFYIIKMKRQIDAAAADTSGRDVLN